MIDSIHAHRTNYQSPLSFKMGRTPGKRAGYADEAELPGGKRNHDSQNKKEDSMKQTAQNIRHGDLCLVQEAKIAGQVVSFDKLPEGLKAENTTVLMKGSHGNDHAFTGGTFYPTTDTRHPFLIGYFVAGDDAKLLHPDHGDKRKGSPLRVAKVPDGVYGVFGQHEITHDQMRPVLD